MKFVEVTISAATKEERSKIVGLIATTAAEVESSLTELQPTGPSRKKAIEIGTVVTVLLQGAAAIGSGLVANMIYDKIKAASRTPDRLVKRSTETEVEIIDEKSGARIIVKKREIEDIAS